MQKIKLQKKSKGNLTRVELFVCIDGWQRPCRGFFCWRELKWSVSEIQTKKCEIIEWSVQRSSTTCMVVILLLLFFFSAVKSVFLVLCAKNWVVVSREKKKNHNGIDVYGTLMKWIASRGTWKFFNFPSPDPHGIPHESLAGFLWALNCR